MKKIYAAATMLIFILGLGSFAIISNNRHPEITGTKVGEIATDLTLRNPEGKILKLSDLRGQYVILDFWASWCGPCRRSNPALVRVYNTFANKKFENGNGLTVFSVSLDKEKDAWLNAIKFDHLDWPNHVCEFMGWNSRAAAIYGVETIPTNFIIDGSGKIIAIDLQDAALVKFLSSKEKK